MSDDITKRLDRLESGQADIKAALARLEPLLTKLLDGQVAQGERLARVEGRLDEQSSMLQLVIASRMGRKPAA